MLYAPLLLTLEDRERFGGIGGRDDAVGDFALDDVRGHLVARVGQGDPVAEGGHSVRPSGARIGAGERRIVKALDVVHKARLFERGRELLPDRRRRGRDVLEAGRRHHARRLFELLDELPGIEGVQEIDIPRVCRSGSPRQIASIRHEDARGLLIGVAAVF